MWRSVKYGAKTLVGVFFLFLWCEYFIYFIVLNECHWPELDPQNEDTTAPKLAERPVKAMVLADTHLLGSRHGHWFDKLRREWQMFRTFQTAMTLHNPDVVFVLGDLMDEGLYCSSMEFQNYVRRFYRMFEVQDGTQLYVVAGNHDMGFHYGISPYLNERFVSAFNTPSVQLISVRGVHFVLVNSMALEGDGCFLCKPAELQLAKIEKILQCANGTRTKSCETAKKLDSYSRPILMQHYPLYRESDMECEGEDSAPLPLKKQRFREGWDCIGKDASKALLKQIRPRIVMSGHTHHGCTRKLPTGDGVEITVPSFSWRNKDNPNFGMAVLTPNNFAYSKCLMPKESTVYFLYICGFLCLGLWLMYVFTTSPRRYKFKRH